MKLNIIKQLKRAGKPVSGEALSRSLGISRVSVWKHIHGLMEKGYQIETGAKGYRLTLSPDIPYAWEFPEFKGEIHYYPEIGSTMDPARELARNGCPPFTVVVADRQTKGRGRMKRTWHSGDGGLYMTLVFRPRIAPTASARTGFLTATILVETLNELYGIDANMKWPNDILVKDRKLCGMLSEMEAEGDLVSFVNIGIGVNLNNDPEIEEARTVSVKRLVGRTVKRNGFLERFLSRLQKQKFEEMDKTVMAAWKRHAVTLNRPVRVETIRETISGMAVDVDDLGSLIVKLDNGTTRKVSHGDCFHDE